MTPGFDTTIEIPGGEKNMLRVGVIGLGYWGPNLVRNFAGLANCQMAAICDLNRERLQHVYSQFPTVFATTNMEEMLNRDLIDAAVIATPTKTHYPVAKKALENGLHTFVEKPLATTSSECEELIQLAEQKGVVLFVGHIFLYSAAVSKLKELVVSGELGNLCYISSTRLNLGPVRQDVNALWDLAPHDISIILDLMNSCPTNVNCHGLAYLNKNVHDVCSLSIDFENNSMAIVHVSWLDPRKRRIMTIVGDKKMAIYNDIEQLEKIKIYDKGVEAPAYSDTFGEFQFSYRYGDIHCPRLVEVEPLKSECQHFLECVNDGKRPKTDGRNGLEVVRVLQMAEHSLLNGGGRVELSKIARSSKRLHRNSRPIAGIG